MASDGWTLGLCRLCSLGHSDLSRTHGEPVASQRGRKEIYPHSWIGAAVLSRVDSLSPVGDGHPNPAIGG